MASFTRSTTQLASLREQLTSDLAASRAQAGEALAKFEAEAQGIKDPAIIRNMTVLGRKTEEADRERNATETIALLDNVLLKGSDLQHAANCIMIANNLHQQAEVLDTQITDAKTSATEYQTTTNTLLAKITTVLAER